MKKKNSVLLFTILSRFTGEALGTHARRKPMHTDRPPRRDVVPRPRPRPRAFLVNLSNRKACQKLTHTGATQVEALPT
jgi:hypothetical protein